eukprot:CAMPEP_0197837016 /NCGR_PEP_ID=MMETSP1437-20131217/30837_1 /TAXON_ID=49252 ORGANISM="Eucampia antarctica, Strain CCMP1452" /NCGR_SAMPLE_ID=MMETSP1437 /ASSEMBLY_ACC=CAM_ASM_001096 /LENGTH=688 /DNA_ID=CAMNT_0043443689 /DNA_START=33 /DNA_END=2099 /DNA_ORIENTATION=-
MMQRGLRNSRLVVSRRWKSTIKNPSIKISNEGSSSYSKMVLIGASSACGLMGFGLGSSFVDNSSSSSEHQDHHLPSGFPSSCCSCDEKSPEQQEKEKLLVSKLTDICGSENVISKPLEMKMYCKGARIGKDGKAVAVITPGSLRQVVQSLQIIVDANGVILPQGANTGLTGGSTPREGEDGDDEGRICVVVNMKKHLNAFFPIDNGKRVVCLAGAGIADLAAAMKPWGFPDRESHSILGSTFLNPTVAAGVAYGSGGTQLRKGPAYTDRSLYVKIDKDKWGNFVLNVANTLGVEGLQDSDFVTPECGSAIEQLDIYARDVQGQYQRAMASSTEEGLKHKSSNAQDYKTKVTTNTSPQNQKVNRYNADTSGIDVNRSEGKVFILATVHDTFPSPDHKKSYWISFDSLQNAYDFREKVALHNTHDLPISMEYMNNDSIDVICSAGKVLATLITNVGMGSPLIGMLWDVKLKVESLPFTWASTICDTFMYHLNNIMPAALPSDIQKMTNEYSHHVSVTVGDWNQDEMKHFEERMQSYKEQNKDKMKIYKCQTAREEEQLSAFRFVAAPAFRTWCVGNHVQGISVDYALPHNYTHIPQISEKGVAKRMRYSHFGCNVIHEDLAYEPNINVELAKMSLKKTVEHDCHGKLPAEHGHGTEYKAPVETQKRWKRMDPLNVMNPGIGGTSAKFKYQ